MSKLWRSKSARTLSIFLAFCFLWTTCAGEWAQAAAAKADRHRALFGEPAPPRLLSAAELKEITGGHVVGPGPGGGQPVCIHGKGLTMGAGDGGGELAGAGGPEGGCRGCGPGGWLSVGRGDFSPGGGQDYITQQVVRSNSTLGPSVVLTINHNSKRTVSPGNPLGDVWSHNFNLRVYELENEDVVVVSAGGAGNTFTHNVDDTYTAPAGVWDTLVKNQDNTFTLTLVDQTEQKFYAVDGDPPCKLHTITDPNGNTVTCAYDGSDRLETLTDASSNVTTFAYDGSSRISTITNPASDVTTFTYDGNNDLQTVTTPEGNTTTYAYTSNRITSVTNPDGDATTFSYDGSSRLTGVTDAEGKATAYAYSGSNCIVTDANGKVTTYSYEGTSYADALSTMTDANGKVTTYVYDSSDRLTSVTDPLGHTTAYTYSYKCQLP